MKSITAEEAHWQAAFPKWTPQQVREYIARLSVDAGKRQQDFSTLTKSEQAAEMAEGAEINRRVGRDERNRNTKTNR